MGVTLFYKLDMSVWKKAVGYGDGDQDDTEHATNDKIRYMPVSVCYYVLELA